MITHQKDLCLGLKQDLLKKKNLREVDHQVVIIKKKKQNIITDSSDDESYQDHETGTTKINDDESDNETDFKEISYEGEKYLVSSDNDVYDPDTADVVGKFINNKIEFN